MYEMVGNPINYSGSNYAVKFALSKRKFRDNIIKISVTQTDHTLTGVKWAVLQAYREDVKGEKEQEIKIDGPGWAQKCLTTSRRPNTEPPYCTSCLERSDYATTIFDDPPAYDCKKEGSLTLFTFFSIMSSNNLNTCPFNCTYEIKIGVKWGIRQDSKGRMNPIALSRMDSAECKEVLDVFRWTYPNARFICQ